MSKAVIRVEPIDAHSVQPVAQFLHRNLNRHISPRTRDPRAIRETCE